jgi:S-ribosylhomocysteine lyase
MKKIKSFCINHDKLQKGFYVSRIDGDVITYDIRMVVPNRGPYLDNAGLHTFEHLFATYVRSSSYSDRIVYVGPMGCRTGFYYLTRDTMTKQEALDLFRETLDFMIGYHGPVPGAEAPRECGNWLNHDLEECREYAKDMKEVLKDWTPEMMVYPE